MVSAGDITEAKDVLFMTAIGNFALAVTAGSCNEHKTKPPADRSLVSSILLITRVSSVRESALCA
jgi:hypothetical protein